MGERTLELKNVPVVVNDLEDKGFELLKRMVLSKLGLDCSYYRDNYLRRRLEFRMSAHGIKSYPQYVGLLRSNPDEYDRLIKDLTINYTKFFRDPDVFLHFKTTMLPELLKNKKSIRILSAGCSSGEEPYTLSMIINDVLGLRLKEFSVSIYAVDIDQKCLKKAGNGEYEEREVAEVERRYLDRYFDKKANSYQVKDEIRRLVRFSSMDLTQDLKIKWLDVIFCRNVFIYFSKPAQAIIFKRFHEALGREGYMVIGKSEMLPDEVRGKFTLIDTECRVYKKIDETSS
jgi:chemotaxis protein methyltransferase CheR